MGWIFVSFLIVCGLIGKMEGDEVIIVILGGDKDFEIDKVEYI